MLYTKSNSKRIKDLNANTKTIKIIEDIRQSFCNLVLGSRLLDMTPKSQVAKKKERNFTSSNFKILGFKFHQQMKKKIQVRENLCK